MKSEPSTKASTKRIRFLPVAASDVPGGGLTKPNVYGGFVTRRARCEG